MKQVLVRQGRIEVADVPPPTVLPGTVLVALRFSAISPGTELAGLERSGRSLLQRALEQPERARRVLKEAWREGWVEKLRRVREKVSMSHPTGYSAAGIVLEVAEGASDFRPGERVACAGAEWAHHAELILVPKRLCVPVPEGVPLDAAATATLGAIALQGVRRAAPQLGEVFVVWGLGALGQLALQLLIASGARVLGVDPVPERRECARMFGCLAAFAPGEGELDAAIDEASRGAGADAAIITAASRSEAIANLAARSLRKKGRLVIVGDVPLTFERAALYAKELDVLVSTSYGPGRYDSTYEIEGHDYPLPYVRWTLERNLQEYLRLLEEGKVRVDPLIGARFPLVEAPAAYAALQERRPRPLLVLLEAAGDRPHEKAVELVAPAALGPRPGSKRVRIAVIGAGEFAATIHLPNLARLETLYELRAVVCRRGHRARELARRYGARYAVTDPSAAFEDGEVDAVLIATRHDLHAELALRALRAGKHVLLEKPLALDPEGLEALVRFFEENGPQAPCLLVGFNRRFSPCLERLRSLLGKTPGPLVAQYRVNAPALEPGHWVYGPEGGGRNLGEACHMYDAFVFLTQSTATAVGAHAVYREATGRPPSDNFIASLRFEDGSLACLTYTASGHERLGKERLEVFAGGAAYVLDDYRTLEVFGRKRERLRLRRPDKGHRAELEAFARTILEGGEWPVPLSHAVEATRIAFEVEARLRPRTAVPDPVERVEELGVS